MLMTAARLQAAALDLADFGARPDGSDSTPALQAALQKAASLGGPQTLRFAPGRYEFFPDRAPEEYLYVSNNDDSLKRIAFKLKGFKDLTIDGQGATLMFHGFTVPFWIHQSQNITLQNFKVDFARTFHSESKIEALTPDGAEVSFGPEYPFKIEHGILAFYGENKTRYGYSQMLEFDPIKRETALHAHDYWLGSGVRADDLGHGKVRIYCPKLTGTPGNTLVFGPNHRLIPGVIIDRSSDIRLQEVTLHHSGGMGIIAQNSRNILMEKVSVTPAPGRVVSLTADATHFVNCEGNITFRNCLFENQKDDATNIHGIYVQVSKKLAPDALEVHLVHPQQFGFELAAAGEQVELVNPKSMVTYGQARLRSVEKVNREFSILRFTAPLPETVAEGDAIARDVGYPEVLMEGCTIRGNRARGVLLGSRAKMVLRNNTFHTPGAAILLEGDARFWFEQAGVRELLIEKNRFIACNFGPWGNACIQVGAGISKECREQSRYNQNVRIENNVFEIFDPRLLNLYSIKGLSFKNNKISWTDAYPRQNMTDKPFVLESCEETSVTDVLP